MTHAQRTMQTRCQNTQDRSHSTITPRSTGRVHQHPTAPAIRAARLGEAIVRGALLALAAIACASGASCRRDEPVPEPQTAPENSTAQREERPDLLVFPDSLRVEDPNLNAFVQEAMKVCAAGDYDRFRLLWSASEEPLSRGEYEQGWQAVQRVTIHALEPLFFLQSAPDGDDLEPAYAVLGTVLLDSTHAAAQDKPQREVVLVIVREHGEWRLKRAKAAIRTWLISHAAQQAPPAQEVNALDEPADEQ